METNLGYLLLRAANKFPDKEALIYGEKRVTYKHLDERANRVASALIDLGVKKGDKIALLLHNSIEYLECLFGINRAGAVSVPVNHRLKPEELKYILGQSESRVLIYESDFTDVVIAIRKYLKIDVYICLGEKGADINYEKLLNRTEPVGPRFEVAGYDPATILFTSGTTTGRPKGVVLTNNNHVWSCLTQTIDYQLINDDVFLTATPLFHTSALNRCFGAVFLGGTNIIMEKFQAKQFLEIVQNERVTFTVLIPTMFAMVKQALESVVSDLSSVRSYVTGGALTHTELLKSIIDTFPNAQIRNSYGCTECFTVVINPPHQIYRKLGSVGKPAVNSEIRIIDIFGAEVRSGEIGEICVRGPSVGSEYYKNEKATAESFNDGWFKTDDLGRFDDEGFLYIVDRKKDIIISGGENISSVEVEEVLYQHKKIAEVAVIGVPDDLWGESVRAIVVPRPGVVVTEREIINFSSKTMAGYKKPKSVVFVESLPKNSNGKILKQQLREKYGRKM